MIYGAHSCARILCELGHKTEDLRIQYPLPSEAPLADANFTTAIETPAYGSIIPTVEKPFVPDTAPVSGVTCHVQTGAVSD